MALTNQRRNIMTAGFTAAAPGTGTATVGRHGAIARGVIFLQSSLPLTLQ